MNKLLMLTIKDIMALESKAYLSKGVTYISPTNIIMNTGDLNKVFNTDVHICNAEVFIHNTNFEITSTSSIPKRLIVLI